MNKANIDVSVLILFFNRPDTLSRLFEVIRRVRPSRLFLYQDGPRSDADLPQMEECRRIVENIDWECDVNKSYQTVNRGCDPSNFISQRWAFSKTDKCIVLEDDDVPSDSFFRFCKEMLDKYENDERIVMINGFNTDEKTEDAEYDYFFTRAFSIWGWASWARVVNNWDRHYGFLDSQADVFKLQEMIKEHHLKPDMLRIARQHKASGKEFYESIAWAYMTLHEGLAIMPRVNMIQNLGYVGTDSTHYSGLRLECMPCDIRRQFTMGTYDLEFPLKCPPDVVADTMYNCRVNKRNAWGYPGIKIRHSLEELWLNIIHGNFPYIWKMLKNRISIFLSGKKYW